MSEEKNNLIEEQIAAAEQDALDAAVIENEEGGEE